MTGSRKAQPPKRSKAMEKEAPKMRWTMKDIINSVGEAELYELQRDLGTGGLLMSRLIGEKIAEIEKKKKGVCATCGLELEAKEKSHTLIFGPDGFRKRASFCEADCLIYFLNSMKHMDAARTKRPIESARSAPAEADLKDTMPKQT